MVGASGGNFSDRTVASVMADDSIARICPAPGSSRARTTCSTEVDTTVSIGRPNGLSKAALPGESK